MEANLGQIQNLQTTEEDLKSYRHTCSLHTAFVDHTALWRINMLCVWLVPLQQCAADGMSMSDWDVHVNYSREMSTFQPHVIHPVVQGLIGTADTADSNIYRADDNRGWCG